MNPRVKLLLWIGGIAGGAVAALILFCFDPVSAGFYPVCTFHAVTGLDCPGCGSLRAVHALLHGRFLEALRFNALTVLSIPILGWFLFRLARRQFLHGPPVVVRPAWLWWYFTAWITFGIARDLPVPLLAWFAP